MSSDSAPAGGNRRSVFLLVGVFVLVVYVLSPLPLQWVLMKLTFAGYLDEPDGWTSTAFRVIYMPLIWADRNVPLVSRFYEFYGSLFDL